MLDVKGGCARAMNFLIVNFVLQMHSSVQAHIYLTILVEVLLFFYLIIPQAIRPQK